MFYFVLNIKYYNQFYEGSLSAIFFFENTLIAVFPASAINQIFDAIYMDSLNLPYKIQKFLKIMQIFDLITFVYTL